MLYAAVRNKAWRSFSSDARHSRLWVQSELRKSWSGSARCLRPYARYCASSIARSAKQSSTVGLPSECSVKVQPDPISGESSTPKSSIEVSAWEQIKPIRRELAITIMSTGVLALGIGAVVPVLPLFMREAAGSSNTAVGLALAAPSLTRALLNPMMGEWADRHGRKPLLIWGPLTTAASQILTGICTSIEGIMPWRLLLGAGQAVQGTGSQMLLADLTQKVPEVRARVMGTTQSSFMIGFSLGPGLSGFLVDAYGPQSAFFAVAAGCTVAGFCNGFLRETLPPEVRAAALKRLQASQSRDRLGVASDNEKQPAAGKTETLPLWGLQWAECLRKTPDINAAAVVQCASALAFGGGFTVLPLLMTEVYGATGAQLGLIFSGSALCNLAGSGIGAVVADRFGRKAVAVPALAVQAISLAAMAASPDLFTIVAFSCVRSVAGGALMPALNAFCADAVTPEERGPTLAALRTVSDLGWLVGPIMAGLLADVTSPATVLLANGMITAIACAHFQVCAQETLQKAKAAAVATDSKKHNL